MREIKFRAWDGKEMFYPAQITFTEAIWSVHPGRGVSIHYQQHIELMQFTGLLDKNGKEIYLGDILNDSTGKSMLVGWSDKFASFVLNRDGWAFSHWFGESCNPDDCEIIGNIHQNPELLQS